MHGANSQKGKMQYQVETTSGDSQQDIPPSSPPPPLPPLPWTLLSITSTVGHNVFNYVYHSMSIQPMAGTPLAK